MSITLLQSILDKNQLKIEKCVGLDPQNSREAKFVVITYIFCIQRNIYTTLNNLIIKHA